MMEVANSILAKDPNNLGMLLLVSDYYGEKGEQLDKAEAYAHKAATLAESAPKPADVNDDQWKQQTSLQKGLALSTLGQINLQKKNNAAAVQNFQAASPLLKSNDTSYARNQYRMGFAFVNLKKIPEARAAFTEAASVNSPYKSYAPRHTARPAEPDIRAHFSRRSFPRLRDGQRSQHPDPARGALVVRSHQLERSVLFI